MQRCSDAARGSCERDQSNYNRGAARRWHLGAHHAINYREQDFAAAVAELTASRHGVLLERHTSSDRDPGRLVQ
jgi:hypothetical protein